MHGPYPPPGDLVYKSPTWPALPRVPVLDTIATTLRPKRRRAWRNRRTASLDRWKPCGLRFVVTEADPSGYPTLDPNGGDAALSAAIASPYLRLLAIPSLYGGGGGGLGSEPAVAYWDPATNPGAYAAFYMTDFWLHSNLVQGYRITHEIGHCLGLSHHLNAVSVMGVTASGYWMGTADPDAHDLGSLHTFYGLA